MEFLYDTLKISKNNIKPEFILEYSNPASSNFVYKKLILKNINKSRDTIVMNYLNDGIGVDICFTKNNDFWRVEVQLTAYRAVDLKRFFIRLNNLDKSFINCLKGSEAIQKNDNSFNVTLSPFSNRIIKFENASNSFTVIASHFKDAQGIEYIDSNDFYLFSPTYHADRLFYFRDGLHSVNYNYRPLKQNDTISAVFYISENEVEFPIINLFPSNKKAALSIQNDADCESADRIKAVYWGSNKLNSSDNSEQGIFAHNIHITNSVFGKNYPLLNTLWQEIMEKGNTIAYHTYEDGADNIDSLYANLSYLKPLLNIRTWIDHSSISNPEDLAINGLIADSAQYIYPILKDNKFNYAWIDDYKSMNMNIFNAFDDLSMLPHRSYSLAKDYPLYIFTRFRTVTWDYLDTPYSIMPLIIPTNLDFILSKRGYTNIYTHLFYGNGTNIEGFLQFNPNNEIIIKPAADSMFQMLDYYQTYKNLWIAPSEEIFDRFFATDSVSITDIFVSANKIEYNINNFSSAEIKDFELIYKSQSKTIPHFLPKSSQIVTFVPEHTTPNEPQINQINFSKVKFNTLYEMDRIQIKSSESLSPFISNISLYNIKGQKYHYPIQLIDNKISFNRNILPSSILFCKIELKDKQYRVLKINNVK